MGGAVLTPARRRQLLRFVLVGTLAAGVQTVLLWTFVDIGGWNYLLGAAVAIEITIILQYVLNNAWTFSHAQHVTLRAYLVGMGKTNLVRGTAIPIQLAILYALVSWLSIGYIVANGGAIGITGVYRYLLDAYWTWG